MGNDFEAVDKWMEKFSDAGGAFNKVAVRQAKPAVAPKVSVQNDTDREFMKFSALDLSNM